MKSKTFNEFCLILKGCITGALFFSGISLIIILLIKGDGATLPLVGNAIKQMTNSWTLGGAYTVFFVAGIVGLFFGFIERKSNLIAKLYAPVVALGIFMVVGLWIVYIFANGTLIPREVKLTDCTNSVINVNFKVPKGHAFYLLLKTTSTNSFSGNVKILEGTSVVTNLSISSSNTEAVCWFLQPQTNYVFQITFVAVPPKTAVWFKWLQAYKDRKK